MTGDRVATSAPGRQAPWRLALAALIIAETAAGLETSLMFAALPTVLKSGARPTSAAWLITSYLLVSAASAAACSRLGDIKGRRRVLLWTLGVATIGSIISLLSQDIRLIVAGRAIQGLSGAVLPLCYGVLRESVPARKVPLGIGLLCAANSFSAAAGFLIGGMIVDSFSWQHVFTCSAVMCGLGFLSCLAVVPRSPPRPQPAADLLGGLLFCPAIAGLLWAIGAFHGGGVLRPGTWLWLGGSIALLAAWVRHEWRHPCPLIDVRLLADRRILAANIAAICAAMGALQVLQIFPLLFQQPPWTGIGFGLSATVTGLLKLPSNVASVLGATWGGALCARLDSRRVILVAAVCQLIAWIGIKFFCTDLAVTVLLVCLSSAGFATMFAGLINLVMDVGPVERTSEVTSLTLTARTVAQSVGGQIVGGLLAVGVTIGGNGAVHPAPSAFQNVFSYLAVVSAVGVASAIYLLGMAYRRPAPAPAVR